MLFYPPASRPDTAHRVLGHDAARCRNISAIRVRHRTGDCARLFQPVDHDVERLVPWGKIMPAGGAFGEKGLESLKVAFLQGIECSMRDGQISFLEWGQFDVVNVSHVAASALVGQRGTFPATPERKRVV